MHQTQSPDPTVSGAPGNTNLYVLDVMRRAEQELRQLIEKRAEISKRIGTVQRTMVGLAKLFGDDTLRTDMLHLFARERGTRRAGITWACRKVLMESRRPMGARDVCDEIQRTGPALLANHKHPTASITTILRRLVDYGEAKAMRGDDGQCAWLWVAERASKSIQKTNLESESTDPACE